MTKAEAKREIAKIDGIVKSRQKAKMGLYLNTHMPFSYMPNIWNYVYTAVRGIGKSVISVEYIIQLKRKYGYDNVKAYYFRLKDDSIKAMLANKAEKAIDPYLIDKYKLDITVKGNIIFDHGKRLIEFYPLVSAGSKGKGVNLYDCNFFHRKDKNGKPIKTFIVTIWDEFLMAEGVEKKSVGDPVAQYKIYREAIMRDAEALPYKAVANFLLANSVSECAAVTGALFNYIPNPENHKIVKLTRRHAVFWNVPVTDAYIEKRKKSYNADIIDFSNDMNYNNIVRRDMELIKPKKTQLIRVTELIKFDKNDKKRWFAVYDSKYIRLYRGETVNKSLIVPMKRYLDEIYSQERVVSVFERFDNRFFGYCDIMSQALFSTELKLIKSK